MSVGMLVVRLKNCVNLSPAMRYDENSARGRGIWCDALAEGRNL